MVSTVRMDMIEVEETAADFQVGALGSLRIVGKGKSRDFVKSSMVVVCRCSLKNIILCTCVHITGIAACWFSRIAGESKTALDHSYGRSASLKDPP